MPAKIRPSSGADFRRSSQSWEDGSGDEGDAGFVGLHDWEKAVESHRVQTPDGREAARMARAGSRPPPKEAAEAPCDDPDPDAETCILHLDELAMPERPAVAGGPRDREVWVDPMPQEEDMSDWNEAYGEIKEVFRVPDIATGEPSDRGYIVFKEHDAAVQCVEALTAQWSESERAAAARRDKRKASYPMDLAEQLAGRRGEHLAKIRQDVGASGLILRGCGSDLGGYRRGANRPEDRPASSRVHFVCTGPAEIMGTLQQALEIRLQEVHGEMTAAIARGESGSNEGRGGARQRSRSRSPRRGEEGVADGDGETKPNKDEAAAEYFASLPEHLTEAEAGLQKIIFDTMKKVAARAGTRLAGKVRLSQVAQDQAVGRAKKGLNLPWGVGLALWVQKRMTGISASTDHTGEILIRQGASDHDREQGVKDFFSSLPADRLTEAEEGLLQALQDGFDEINEKGTSHGRVRFSLVAQLPNVKEAKTQVALVGVTLSQWISNRADKEFGLVKVPNSGELDMQRKNEDGSLDDIEPAAMADQDFFDQLPEELSGKEVDLRDVIVEILTDLGGRAKLSVVSRDVKVHSARSALLPKGTPLARWVERRLSEVIRLTQPEELLAGHMAELVDFDFASAPPPRERPADDRRRARSSHSNNWDSSSSYNHPRSSWSDSSNSARSGSWGGSGRSGYDSAPYKRPPIGASMSRQPGPSEWSYPRSGGGWERSGERSGGWQSSGGKSGSRSGYLE